MTALYIDGFEDGAYATRYTVAGTPTLIAGRLGADTAIQCSAAVQLVRGFTASATVFVGFGYRHSGGTTQLPIIEFFGDSGGTIHGNVRRESTGAISIYRGTTQVAISAAGAVPTLTWGYMEVQHSISDTVGVLTVKWNGTTIVTFTGDTKNAGTSTNTDAIRIGPTGASNQSQYDDLYIFNALGSVNNTFAGDSRVQTLVPAAAGNSTQLTPTGSGTNWQNVDELPFSATDYNGSATIGHKDTYGMTDLLATTTTVKCVQENMVAHKSDAGVGGMKTVIRSAGTDYADAASAIGTTPGWFGTLREQDPATTAAWTVAGVNALEVGAEVT